MNAFQQELRARLTRDLELSEAVIAKSTGLDHPAFDDIEVGNFVDDYAVVLFLDIRGFTRLSMALDIAETARVVDAVVSAAASRLRAYGAHINDFPGDGIMAVFSETDFSDRAAVHGASLFGVAHLMAEMTATLRDELLNVGVADPVQVAIGLDSGDVRWQRVGIAHCNRLMVLGEVAPLAAKFVTDAETTAWQTVAGGAVVDDVPLRMRQQLSDFVRTYGGQKMTRERWLLDTEKIYREAPDLERSADLIAEARRPPASTLLGAVTPPVARRGRGDKRDTGVG